MEQRLARSAQDVAQIFNLLYRRVALGRTLNVSKRVELSDVLRIANPRYSRVQLCVTAVVVRSHVTHFPATLFAWRIIHSSFFGRGSAGQVSGAPPR